MKNEKTKKWLSPFDSPVKTMLLGGLPNIEIHFLHYDTYKEAVENGMKDVSV